MKKLKVLGLAAIAAGMFSLTSCLDGGGNTQQLSSYAIVDYSSTMRTLIYPLGYYPLYVATIANDPTYSAGDCVLANFTVDFDSADNANASTNGFYVATGAASSPLAKYDLSYSPLDSMALDNELLLSGSESALLFSNNYKRIVVIPTFTSVCLRAQKREEGKAPTISNAMDPIAVEGGTLYSMLKGKESAAGKKIVSYRVKYPLTFNADSTKIATWGYSKISQFSIEEATN